MRNWAGSIARGNRMLLESSLENWKELRLRLRVNRVERQALWWGGLCWRFVGRVNERAHSSTENGAWYTAVTPQMLLCPDFLGKATPGRTVVGDGVGHTSSEQLKVRENA